MMEKGKMIVIEGACDGIGKSTQYALLRERLVKDGLEVVNHHFPSYGTYQGTSVEKYLSGEFGYPKDNSPYFVNSLYAIDRAITWRTKLKSEYELGKVILLDRYTTSSIIYQAALFEDIEDKKKFIDYITDFEYEKLEIQRPDIVIFLTADFDLVTKIRNARKVNEGIKEDIHERDLEFMKKIYDNALFVASYLGWDKVECDKDGQMRSIEEIHEDVYKLLKKKK